MKNTEEEKQNREININFCYLEALNPDYLENIYRDERGYKLNGMV